MNWQNYYSPPDMTLWRGRLDSPPAACFFQMIKPCNLQDTSTDTTRGFALLGFNCDEGIKRNLGRIGAAAGPTAIREMLAKMPIQTTVPCFDAGSIHCKDNSLEDAQTALGTAVHLLLAQHKVPILLGGGHEIAWGHYQGIAQQYPQSRLGIVNFDAHFDMRPLLSEQRGSSGTSFLQIAKAHQVKQQKFNYACIGIQRAANIPQLFNTAAEFDVKVLLADDLQNPDPTFAKKFIKQIVDANDFIYLSLCLDVLSSAYAPGVSAPQPLGLTPWQILPLIRQLAQSGKVISYDIAELSPPFDKDDRTAKLAANFVYEIIHHHALED